MANIQQIRYVGDSSENVNTKNSSFCNFLFFQIIFNLLTNRN